MGVADDLRSLIPSAEARSAPSNQQKRSLDSFFADQLSISSDLVYTVSVSKAGNLKVRFDQSERGRRSKVAVALLGSGDELEASLRAAAPFVGRGRKDAVVLVAEHETDGWGVVGLVEEGAGPVWSELSAHWSGIKRIDPAPSHVTAPPFVGLAVPLAMTERTSRMARLAIATAPAVLFVGPPGTGKNRLLREILQEIAMDPGRYGFTKSRETVVEPAEEGWSTRDLVGGETVDERSRLRFMPGRVLDAIAHDRWIVIDEANRADLDKIFGGLLTWLAGDQVVVGRASTDVEAPLVRLGWSDSPDSFAIGAERLDEDDVGKDPIEYWAGSEFRLLGTYNALDAHRVFRFGLALGRRFAQVPVGPAPLSDFEVMMDAQEPNFPAPKRWQEVRQAVLGIYAAHLGTPGAQLGPGMFLGLPEYVGKGLDLHDLAFGDEEPSDTTVKKLISEGYVMTTGAWLARLDEHAELPQLGITLTSGTNDAPPPMTEEEWRWVVQQLPLIGG
jgi:hypothetical protein